MSVGQPNEIHLPSAVLLGLDQLHNPVNGFMKTPIGTDWQKKSQPLHTSHTVGTGSKPAIPQMKHCSYDNMHQARAQSCPQHRQPLCSLRQCFSVPLWSIARHIRSISIGTLCHWGKNIHSAAKQGLLVHVANQNTNPALMPLHHLLLGSLISFGLTPTAAAAAASLSYV